MAAIFSPEFRFLHVFRKMLILLPLLGVLFNGLTTAHVEANLSLEFKATKVSQRANFIYFRVKFVVRE